MAGYCKLCNVEYQREYRATESGRRRHKNVQLRAKYGITLEQYEELWTSQGGLCAICGKSEGSSSAWGGSKMLAVDHDHETGRVRGLLCQACNVGIGHLTNSEVLLAAAAYLVQNETAIAIP